MEADTAGRESQLPSSKELQQHMSDTAAKPSDQMPDRFSEGGAQDQTSVAVTEAPIGDEHVARVNSYKSPIELSSAPSSGKVTIAGRRLDTGELVQNEVIHLQDYPSAQQASTGGASLSPAISTAGPHTPAATSAHTAAADTMPSSSPTLTIQETTKTAQQVYVTHAAVAAAAAAAGGLVGSGQHLGVRTSANVAELAVDPAAVVDFDSLSPTSAITAAAPSAFSNDGSTAVGSSTVADSDDVPAVLPEDKKDAAATVQRLRGAGQLQGPAASSSVSTGQPAGQAVNAEDMFIGAGSTGNSPSSNNPANTSTDPSTSTAGFHGQIPFSFSTAPASATGHPSAQGVSAGTAAPARAGYPNPVMGTTAEAHTTAADPAGPYAGIAPVSGSSSRLLAMHDAAAHAAAVAGALAHIGTPVGAAAAMAETATQPAQAVEAAAAAAAITRPSFDEATSPATSTAARAGSLQQQHTLADFLLDEHLDEHLGRAVSAPQHSISSASAVSPEHQVTLSVGTAAAEENVEVLLIVGRSTRLMASDGRVAEAAAVVPHEAVAAIQATSETPEEARSPRHSSLRQLSMSRRQGASSSSAQQDRCSGGLPYGLTVADIVAATVASEERRFRVVSPRGSASPRSGTGDNFFTASSGSAPSTPRGDAAAAGLAVERSTSPMSASTTRAIFDSVQLAVQQQQQQEQLAQAFVRSGSMGSTPAHQQAGETKPAPGPDAAEVSTTGQMASAGSGDSTATSSRPSSAEPSMHEDSADSQAASGVSADSGTAFSADADVTQQNAEVMQDMQDEAAAADPARDAALALSTPATAGDGSTDSAASVCGDSYGDLAGAVSSSKEPTEAGSQPTSISSAMAGDKLAAAVAAGMADPVGAAAAGTDVAATAASAFPSVLFGPGAMPVDVAATPRSLDSISTNTSSPGIPADDTSPQDLSTAAALASSGMAALSTTGLEGEAEFEEAPAVTSDSAFLRVVDAASSAMISTAGADPSAAAAAAAAAAAYDMHAASPDPAAATADAAMLVVDVASTVPGLLEPSDVASAAAAAGAAAAAASTPGMDPQAAAVACTFAAAAPLAPPEEVGAAAASALAGLQDSTGTSAAVAGSGSAPPAGGLPQPPPAFAPMSTDMRISARAVDGPAQASICDQHSMASSTPGPAADLSDVLPILAPAGEVGDAITISSPAFITDTPPSEPAVASASLSTAPLAAAADSTEPTSSSKASVEEPARVGGTAEAEVLNREGLSSMFDPLIVQLALASSAPLEGLGLDESDFLAAHGSSAAAIAAAARELTQSGSFGRAAAGSGMLLLQPHPAASLAASMSLGGPAEGGAIMSHLAAAEQALSQLDTKLQRQRTDSISLGRSAAPGELDGVSLAALGGPAAAEAPAGPEIGDKGSGV